jgi:hypothetical protein
LRAPLSCLREEHPMRPFEQMTEQEQRHHVEEIHGILYLRDDAIAAQHADEHEQFDCPHTHQPELSR